MARGASGALVERQMSPLTRVWSSVIATDTWVAVVAAGVGEPDGHLPSLSLLISIDCGLCTPCCPLFGLCQPRASDQCHA